LASNLIVFDLDGTLIDSRRDLADATNALIVELGGTALSDDEVAAMVGEGAAVLVRRALAAAGLDRLPRGALERFLALYDERLTVHTRPYAGIPEALDVLHQEGVNLAVLTNKPERPTRQILDRLDLARSFQHVVGGDTNAGRKPDPAGLSAIIERAGASAGSTILVGDSPIDLQTARAAGTRVCLARYGFGYRFQPDAFRGDELFVDAPSELPQVLRGSST
jgi:phosphoglycolate phosphatase